MNHLRIVLVEPEIPQNTGNIARTCAVTGAELHLVGPLGFSISDKHVRRAGLDYWKEVNVVAHPSWDAFVAEELAKGNNVYESAWFMTTHASRSLFEIELTRPATLVFGRETRGLGPEILARAGERTAKLPQRPGLRSLNLSNAVAVCAYEAFRQWNFEFE